MRQQGERVAGLLYQISQRIRTAHELAVAIERGESPASLKRGLRMPPRAADQTIAGARRLGAERLREMTGAIADLELASRGGGHGGIGEDTAAVRLVAGAQRRVGGAARLVDQRAQTRPWIWDHTCWMLSCFA